MGLDELARLLMTSTMPVNEREMIIDEIKKLTRKTTESLRVPMSNLYSLATTYYNDDPEAQSQRNKLLFNGLQHFTTGVTKEQLRKLIKYSQLHKIKLDYHDTLETCIPRGPKIRTVKRNSTSIPSQHFTSRFITRY